MKFIRAFLKLRKEVKLQILELSVFQSFTIHGRKEFLKYLVLQGKAENQLGFLKEVLIGGSN